MATTIVRQVRFQNERQIVVAAQILADTTSELTDGVILDFSADVVQPRAPRKLVDKLAITRITIMGAGAWRGTIEFDATTDTRIMSFDVGNSPIDVDFSSFGGIIDPADTGYTGDILLTTVGVTIQEDATIIIYATKHSV